MKIHCYRKSGMNFSYVIENGVDSNVVRLMICIFAVEKKLVYRQIDTLECKLGGK